MEVSTQRSRDFLASPLRSPLLTVQANTAVSRSRPVPVRLKSTQNPMKASMETMKSRMKWNKVEKSEKTCWLYCGRYVTSAKCEAMTIFRVHEESARMKFLAHERKKSEKDSSGFLRPCWPSSKYKSFKCSACNTKRIEMNPETKWLLRWNS